MIYWIHVILTFSPSIVYKREKKSPQLMRFRPGHFHFFLVSFNLFLIILGLRVSLLWLRWQLFCFSKKKKFYIIWLKKQQGNEDGFLQSFIGNCRVECMLIKVHMWKVCNDFFLLDNLWPINLFWWNMSLFCCTCTWVKLSCEAKLWRERERACKSLLQLIINHQPGRVLVQEITIESRVNWVVFKRDRVRP